MDVKKVFLQRDLEEQVYYGPTLRFSINVEKVGSVLLEEVSLWPQESPRAWNSKITQWLRKMGFVVSKSDCSLFIWKGSKGPVCIFVVRRWPSRHRSLPCRSKVLAFKCNRDEGPRGPSLLPRDWSDPDPRRHITHPVALCFEYVLQVPNEGLSMRLHSSREKPEATSWLRCDLRWETIPTNCQKPNIISLSPDPTLAIRSAW